MTDLLVEVRADERTTVATAAVASGASSLPVENLTPFGDDGGQVDIDGTVYDYTGTDESTVDADGSGGLLLLATTLATAVTEGAPVSVLVGGQVAVDVVAVVVPSEDDTESEQIVVPLDGREERMAWPVRVYDPPVPVVVSDDNQSITAAPGVTPDIDPEIVLTPYLTAWLPVDISIPNDTFVPVSWSSNIRAARYGWGALAWSTVDTYITVPRSGIYMVTASAAFAPNANGFRYVQIVIADFDGANERVERMVISPGGSGGGAGTSATQAVKPLPLEEGERVIMKVQQTSGAALDLLGRLDLTAVELTWIAAR